MLSFNYIYSIVFDCLTLHIKFTMSPEVRKRTIRQEILSMTTNLWITSIFAISFLFLFSVSNANNNLHMTILKPAGPWNGHDSTETGLTRALNNILKEGVVTNHEPRNLMDAMEIKIRKELEGFRQQVEGVHILKDINGSNEDSLKYVLEEIMQKSASRQKRDTIIADTMTSVRQRRNISLTISDNPYVITSVNRMDQDIYFSRRILDINVVEMGKLQFIFTVEETEQGRYTIIYLLQNGLDVKQVKQILTPSATSVEVIKINNRWYFLPVEGNYSYSSSQDPLDKGSHVYRFDLATYHVFKEQTISTAFAKTALFWKGSGDEANTIYMAIVPQHKETKNGFIKNNVNISCYHWQGGYLDYSFSIPAYNPQAIAHFSIFDNEYLAVANYQDDTGSTSIYSEIFKYNHKESKYISFQRILTYGAKDIKHFSFRNGPSTEHYLAIANFCRKDINGECEFRLRSVIYKYSADRFLPFQTISTNGASQFLPLNLYGKFLLCMVELHGIKFLQYNGWNFVETFVTNFEEPLKLSTGIRLRGFAYNKQPFFSIASTQPSIQSGLYSFKFHQKNNFAEKVEDLMGWCDRAVNILTSVNTSHIYHNLVIAPKVNDTEIHLNGPLIFHNLRANLLQSKSFESNGILYDANFYNAMMKKFQTLDILAGEMTVIEKGLSNVVYRNKNQLVTSKVKFQNLEYAYPQITTNKAFIENLNNLNLHEILPKLVYLNHNYSLDQLIVDHVVAKDNVVIPNLNGHPISDYAVKVSGFVQQFTGQNVFLGPVKANEGFRVMKTLNNIHFTNVKFLLKEGNQTFKSPMVLRNSTTKNLYTKYFNEADMHYYFQDAVLKHGNSVITGNKKFASMTVNQLFTESTLSGININDMANQAIYRTGKPHQFFTGQKTQFEKLIVENMVSNTPHIGDNYDFRNFVTVRNNTDYVIEQLHLSGHGIINNLQVHQNLNKYYVRNGRLDVLLNGDSEVQHIRNKDINSLHFENNVDTDHGEINGMHLPSWENVHRVFLEDHHIQGLMDIKGNLIAPAIIVKENFTHDKTDVIHFLKYSAHLNSTTLPGHCLLVFDILKVKGNTYIGGNVNGYNTKEWLYRNFVDGQIISAPKVFLKDLHLLQNVHVMGLYDLAHTKGQPENVIQVIADLMTYSGNQTIRNNVEFQGLLNISNLFGNSISLDEIPFEKMMLVNGNQNIKVKSFFLESIEVRNLLSVSDLYAGLIHGFHLEKVIGNTLLKNSQTPQLIEGVYTFEKGFSIPKIESNGIVKGYNLVELIQGLAPPINGSYYANGTIVLKNGGKVENLSYDGEMNGISSKIWGKNWLLNEGHQVVHTPVKFNTLKAGNVNVHNNKVSGIDIHRLNADSVWTNEPNELATVTFTGNVKFSNGVNLLENTLVNGHNLQKDVLLKEHSRPQIMAGEITFKNGFTVDGNITAKSVNCLHGLDLIGKFALGINRDEYKSQKLVVVGNVTMKHEPEILNSFNKLNWKEYLSDVCWIDRDTEIHREIKFENVTLQKGIILQKGLVISGVNLTELNMLYAGKNKNNEWTENVIFKNGILANDLMCKDITFINGATFNGVNIKELMNHNNVLINGQDQIIHRPMSFSTLTADEIHIKNGVKANGYNLKQDFATFRGENIFGHSKSIGDLFITNHTIDNIAKINGVDLNHWRQQAVFKNKDYNFSKPMYFDNLQVNDMSVYGNVNNLKYNKNKLFLTNRKNQTVKGRMTIDGSRQPKAYMMNATDIIIQDSINGYNFTKSADNLVMRGNSSDKSPLVLNGEKTFSGPVYVDRFTVSKDKSVYGQNLTSIFYEMETFAHMPSYLNIPLSDKYNAMQKRITELQMHAPDQPVFMAYYEPVATIKFPSVYTKVIHKDGYPLLSLGIKRPQTIIDSSLWNFNLQQNYYVPFNTKIFQNYIQGNVIDFAEVTPNGQWAVITTQRVKDKPVQIDIPLQSSDDNYELFKSEGKLNKAFVLFNPIQSKLTVSQILYGNEFGKILAFPLFVNNELKHCMMVIILNTRNARAEALCFQDDNKMHPLQSIEMKNPSVMTSMVVYRKTIVALADKDDEATPEGVIDIWVNEGTGLLTKESCIPVVSLVHLDSFWTPNYHPYLAIATGYLKGTRNFGGVYIYRYSRDMKIFEKVQTLEINNPLKVRFQYLRLSNEVVLYVLKSAEINNVLVYKYKGIAGWIKIHQFTAENGVELEVLDFKIRNRYYGHLAVSSYKETNVFAVRFKGKNYYDPHST